MIAGGMGCGDSVRALNVLQEPIISLPGHYGDGPFSGPRDFNNWQCATAWQEPCCEAGKSLQKERWHMVR
jgi:hypothetical protein